MSAWFEMKAWLRHRLTAKGPHGIHSPFVFHLITQELIAEKHFHAFDAIEELRSKLLQKDERIDVHDFGAGSRSTSSLSRRICDIAKTASNPADQAQMLFRWANFCQPLRVVELGTNLGLSSAYLSKAVPQASIWSLEGAPALVALARQHLEGLRCNNVTVVEGQFRETLPRTLSDMGAIDLAWLDGHHEKQATLDYMDMIWPYCHSETVLLVDDIHWSAGMNAAWEQLRNDARVTLSLDFYHYGALLFKTGREKEHFRIRV